MGRSRSRSRSRERRRERSRSRERRRERSRSRERRPREDRPREAAPRDSRDARGSDRGGRDRRGRSREMRPPPPREPRGERKPRWEAPLPGEPREALPPVESLREQWAMPAPERRGAGPCFKCGEEGHMARDCPTAPPGGPGGGGGRGACFNCGQEGHMSRDCTNPTVPGAGGNRRRRGGGAGSDENMAWGKPGEQEEEAPPDVEVEPEFGLSGALAAETNTVNGVVLIHQEPAEARKPSVRWRLYVFKNGEPFGEPLHIHRNSCYLFGRERRVADVPTDHPSCSKQHAVLQYRLTEKEGADGMMRGAVRPYLMDLGSTNGTFLNGERIDSQRYYELLEKDLLRFGNSTREYVLLKEK